MSNNNFVTGFNASRVSNVSTTPNLCAGKVASITYVGKSCPQRFMFSALLKFLSFNVKYQMLLTYEWRGSREYFSLVEIGKEYVHTYISKRNAKILR